MSERLVGWVEVRNPTAPWSPGEWAPALDLEAILEDGARITMRPPFHNAAPEDGGPLAPGRGLPADVSDLVAHEAGRRAMPWFCAHLTWAELAPLRRDDHEGPEGQEHGRLWEPLSDDWRLVFRLMAPLAEAYGAEHVRLILWTYITDYS
jgi:hypothetical protein